MKKAFQDMLHVEYKFQDQENSEDIFSFGSALEDFICVVFVPDRNIILCYKGESNDNNKPQGRRRPTEETLYVTDAVSVGKVHEPQRVFEILQISQRL
ncbi:hypothetical protein Tco_1278989 [Tanacetum coccineum]